MKAIVYLVAAGALVIVTIGAVMRGSDSIRNSSGEGVISQETLSESFTDSYYGAPYGVPYGETSGSAEGSCEGIPDAADAAEAEDAEAECDGG